MRTLIRMTAGAVTIALGACSAGGSDGGGGGGGTQVSRGIFTVDLPTGAYYASLPSEAQDTLGTFQTRNEGSVTDVMPGGSATYTGTAAIGIDDDNETVLTTDVTLNADFAGGTISGELDNVTVYSGPDTLTPDDPGDAIEITGGTITGSRYSATLGGDLTLDSEAYLLSADVNGAFVGSNASGTIGLLENGVVQNPDTTSDTFSGVYTADRN